MEETTYERIVTAVTYEDSDDGEFSPPEDEEEEEEEDFSPEDYEADRPADDDDERDAYLAREIQGTASGEGVDDVPTVEASVVTAGGRPKRGAAVRASEAIREAAKKRADAQSRSGSRVSGPMAIFLLLLAIVPVFVCSLVYSSAHAPLAAVGCGMDSNQFARELDAHKYSEALQYSKASYATDSALVNVDEIGNVLYGKRASQPAVLLFVSSDRSDRKRVMNDFVDGLARIYYNASVSPAKFKFTSGPKHDQMKQHIITQLNDCRRGLFAVDADVLLDHFDFMETALEDGVSYIDYGENNQRVYTGDSTFIIMDTLKEELIRRFLHDPATDRSRAKAAIATQVMAKHGSAWSKRFAQRVQDVFVF